MPKEQAPVVRARSRGVVSGSLENFAARYREQFPDRDVRYVYDPTHRPELSGVLGRQAEGYRIVRMEELGLEENPDLPGDKPVRVGDLVMMSISKVERAALRKERDGYAKEQRDSISRQFYAAQEQIADAHKKEGHTRPGTRPIGNVDIQDKTFEYDIEQRSDNG